MSLLLWACIMCCGRALLDWYGDMAADIGTGTLVAPSNDKGVCETPHAVTPHASKTEDLHTDTDSFIPYFSVLCPVNRELD